MATPVSAPPASAAGPAPPRPAQEEAILGKAMDLALLRRLWPFVRPNARLLVAWAVFMPN